MNIGAFLQGLVHGLMTVSQLNYRKQLEKQREQELAMQGLLTNARVKYYNALTRLNQIKANLAEQASNYMIKTQEYLKNLFIQKGYSPDEAMAMAIMITRDKVAPFILDSYGRVFNKYTGTMKVADKNRYLATLQNDIMKNYVSKTQALLNMQKINTEKMRQIELGAKTQGLIGSNQNANIISMGQAIGLYNQYYGDKSTPDEIVQATNIISNLYRQYPQLFTKDNIYGWISLVPALIRKEISPLDFAKTINKIIPIQRPQQLQVVPQTQIPAQPKQQTQRQPETKSQFSFFTPTNPSTLPFNFDLGDNVLLKYKQNRLDMAPTIFTPITGIGGVR